MRDALLAARLHVPADLEGVAGDVADLDAPWNGELLHVGEAAILGFSCVKKKRKKKESDKAVTVTVKQNNIKLDEVLQTVFLKQILSEHDSNF